MFSGAVRGEKETKICKFVLERGSFEGRDYSTWQTQVHLRGLEARSHQQLLKLWAHCLCPGGSRALLFLRQTCKFCTRFELIDATFDKCFRFALKSRQGLSVVAAKSLRSWSSICWSKQATWRWIKQLIRRTSFWNTIRKGDLHI